MRLHVKLWPSRRKLHNGQLVVFRGRIPGPIPSTGVIVLLQVRRDGRWGLFGRVTRAGHKGRFARGYRFRWTTGVQHYHFRAFVPNQYGYPFSAGWSQPVTVEVTG
jgi:hypothetical protein